MHRRPSGSRYNVSKQFGNGRYTSAVHDIFDVPPEVEIRGCRIRAPRRPIKPLPVDPSTRNSLVPIGACNCTKLGWCIVRSENEANNFSCLWEHKHTQAHCTRDGAPAQGKGLKNSLRKCPIR